MKTVGSLLVDKDEIQWDGRQSHPNAEHAPFKLKDEEWAQIRDFVDIPNSFRVDFDVLMAYYASDVCDLVGIMKSADAKKLSRDVGRVREIILNNSDEALRSHASLLILGRALPAWRELSRAFRDLEPTIYDESSTAHCSSSVNLHMHKLIHRLYNILDRNLGDPQQRKRIKLITSTKRSVPAPAGPDFLNLILKIFNDKIRADALASAELPGVTTEDFGVQLLRDEAPTALIRNYITQRPFMHAQDQEPS